MLLPGTPNIFVPGNSVFMLFECMCNNMLIEKIYIYIYTYNIYNIYIYWKWN